MHGWRISAGTNYMRLEHDGDAVAAVGDAVAAAGDVCNFRRASTSTV